MKKFKLPKQWNLQHLRRLLLLAINLTGSALQAETLLPIDVEAYTLSERSGGVFMFWAPGEFKSTNFFSSNGDSLLLARSGDSPPGELLEEIIVDKGAKSLGIFIGAQSLQKVELTDPNGQVATPLTHETLIRTQYMLLGKIDKPTPGRWQLRTVSEGKRSIKFSIPGAADLLEFKLFQFLRYIPLPVHADFFPRLAVPSVGKERSCDISLSSDVREVILSFESLDGSVVQQQTLRHLNDFNGHYLGSCKVPPFAFRAKLEGSLNDGTKFQRVYPRVLKAGRVINPLGVP